MKKNLLGDGQNVVHDNGKHTFLGAQHELTIHTDLFNEHRFVTLLQDSKIEQRVAGAQ